MVTAMDLQVLVLGLEKEGIPVNLIQVSDARMEIPQIGVIMSLSVHHSGAIAVWEYTRQQRAQIKIRHFKRYPIFHLGDFARRLYLTPKCLVSQKWFILEF